MFNYLIDKIKETKFESYPFKHLTINNFFHEKDFQKIISDPQILRPVASSHVELIDDLIDQGYTQQHFPGCITSIQHYLEFLNNPQEKFNRKLIEGYGRNIIAGYGLTMRLKKIRSSFLEDLLGFLNDSPFQNCLTEKFGIAHTHYIETAYQKNLHGYEISPHADTRKKALTYMVNIYTEQEAEQMPIHTHLMKFKPKYQYLYDFWKYNGDIDTCWVPWNWCDTVKQTNQNNSITIFKPAFDTLHAVKLDYNHLSQQRNQIYGNLWYHESPSNYGSGFQQIDLVKMHESFKLGPQKLSAKIGRKIAKMMGA
ncbi:hypothetical protein AAG747_26590 [Rapidithrix thailandica]|uniref:Uncharacterized protein n=1 Tax=Rapidithrix thailandica TaxID=413964 RepID=A0AAW9SF20_9BACT